MIIVTGATGALNGATIEHLLTRVPASEIGVSVRDVSKAQHFASRGVRVRSGSYADPAALLASFEGADQVLLVSTGDPTDDRPALHQVGVSAAVEAGASRILYTSHQGAAAASPFRPARDHFATEELLAASGVAWTSLRNGFYMHSLDWFLGSFRDTGVISAPADGPVSWTSRDDAAEAAAVLLVSGAPDGPVTLTASQAPTFEDIAEKLSITRITLADEEWVAAQAGPEPMARFALSVFQAARAGFFASTSPVLAEILGREPASVTDYLASAKETR